MWKQRKDMAITVAYGSAIAATSMGTVVAVAELHSGLLVYTSFCISLRLLVCFLVSSNTLPPFFWRPGCS